MHQRVLGRLPRLQQGPWLQGIYTGGLAHANELVQAGRARAREFRLLAGYMHWHEGSLHAEVARGDWWLVAASREYLLSLVRGECICILLCLHAVLRV